MVNALADVATALMNVIAHAQGVVLIHSKYGKDRTGLVSALLLDLVGVRRQHIADDYALTLECLRPAFEEFLDNGPRRRLACLRSEHVGRDLGYPAPTLTVDAFDQPGASAMSGLVGALGRSSWCPGPRCRTPGRSPVGVDQQQAPQPASQALGGAAGDQPARAVRYEQELARDDGPGHRDQVGGHVIDAGPVGTRCCRAGRQGAAGGLRPHGALAPSQTCAIYADAGYDFLVLTDHFLEQYDYPLTEMKGTQTDFV